MGIFSKKTIFFRLSAVSLIFFLFVSSNVFAQNAAAYNLPLPGKMLEVSPVGYSPILRGIKINPQDPLKLEFIIDPKDSKNVTRLEADKLINYFMACLAIPESDLWVNLAPHEPNRIIPEQLSYTDLGRDMLAGDYILKQLSASLTYPRTSRGKRYWQSTRVNDLQKIWIVPDKAEVYVKDNAAFITESSLKLLMEKDNLAFKQNILPQLTQQINQGEHFARLRQVYDAFILAVWFKRVMKDSLFQYYIGQKKVSGIDINDKDAKQKIYDLYLEAFKKGAYNCVKDEVLGGKVSKRTYFSGGVRFKGDAVHEHSDEAKLPDLSEAVRVEDQVSPGFLKAQSPADVRPVKAHLLDEAFVRYDMAVRNQVNPGNEAKVGVYGGAGMDVSGCLLSMNTTENYFIANYAGITVEKLRRLREYRGSIGVDYAKYKFSRGYASSGEVLGDEKILGALAFELEAMGVDLSTVTARNSDNGLPMIEFDWDYSGQAKRKYSITFISGELQYPKTYLYLLPPRIDIYYQNAGHYMANLYDSPVSYIHYVYKRLGVGGAFITDDYVTNDDPRIGVQDRAAAFPVSLSQDNIPDVDKLEADVLSVTVPARLNSGKDSSDSNYYGWRKRIRRKTAQDEWKMAADDAETLYREQKDDYVHVLQSIEQRWFDFAKEHPGGMYRAGAETLIRFLSAEKYIYDPADLVLGTQKVHAIRLNQKIVEQARHLLGQLDSPINTWFIGDLLSWGEIKEELRRGRETHQDDIYWYQEGLREAAELWRALSDADTQLDDSQSLIDRIVSDEIVAPIENLFKQGNPTALMQAEGALQRLTLLRGQPISEAERASRLAEFITVEINPQHCVAILDKAITAIKALIVDRAQVSLDKSNAIHEPEFVQGSIHTNEFIARERADKRPTAVFDLDESIAAGRETGEEVGYILRPGVEANLAKLKAKGVKIVLWTNASEKAVRCLFAQHPEVKKYFDLVISYENYASEEVNWESDEGWSAILSALNPTRDFSKETNIFEMYSGNMNIKNIALLGYGVLVEDSSAVSSWARVAGFSYVQVKPFSIARTKEFTLASANNRDDPLFTGTTLADTILQTLGVGDDNAIDDIGRRYKQLNQEIEAAFTFLLRDYPALLDEKKAEELADRVIALRVNDELAASPAAITEQEQFLGQLRNPPFDWFSSYFKDIDDTELAWILSTSRIVNVAKGCSVQCDACYSNAGKNILYISWPHLVEIAARLKKAGIQVVVHYYDSDPLRDYYDPLYGKNYADVVDLFAPKVITTAGFEIGSIGEEAAKRIKRDHPNIAFRVSIKTETQWYRKIGKEAYIKAMRNVISILQPRDIQLLFYGTDDARAFAEAKEVYAAIVGHEPGINEHCVPNAEGRGARLARLGRPLNRFDQTAHETFGYMLEPRGMIARVEPNDPVHIYRLVRKGTFAAHRALWGMIEKKLLTKDAKSLGGIELSTKDLRMRIKGEIKLHVSDQLLEQFKNTKGLKHTILIMQRGVDIKKFLEIAH